MKKILNLALVLGLVIGIFCTSALASDRVEKFEVEEMKDFDVENGSIYILDGDKIKIRTYENVDLEIDLGQVPGYEAGERISLDGGVIYILDTKNSKINMVIYGSPEESKTFQISDLSKVLKKDSDKKDISMVGDYKVISGNLYLNNNEEKNESYLFEKEKEKFLEKEVLENTKFRESFYTREIEGSNGSLTIDGKHKLEIKSQESIEDIRLIGMTKTGKYLVEVDEFINDKPRTSVRIFSSEYKEIDHIDIKAGDEKYQGLYNKARFEDGNLYYLEGDSTIVVRKVDVEDIPFNLFLNGELAEDSDSFIKDGRTFVPIRLISEKLGFDVLYIENNKDIVISKDGQKIQMNVEKMDIVKEEKTIRMDTLPVLKNDRTFVPIRFVGEAFGLDVKWDDKTSTAMIGSYMKEGVKGAIETLEFENLGIKISLPKNYNYALKYEETDDSVKFYDAKNMEEFGGYIGEYKVSKSLSANLVPGYIIDYNKGVFIEKLMATEPQYNKDDKSLVRSYESSMKIFEDSFAEKLK